MFVSDDPATIMIDSIVGRERVNGYLMQAEPIRFSPLKIRNKDKIQCSDYTKLYKLMPNLSVSYIQLVQQHFRKLVTME